MTTHRRTINPARPAPRFTTLLATLLGAALVTSLAFAGGAGALVPRASDDATAKKVLLVKKDVPAGWTGSVQDDDDNDALVAALATCTGEPNPNDGRLVETKGREFENAAGTKSFSSESAVFETVAAARRAFRMYKSNKFPECAEDALRSELAPMLQAQGLTIERVTFAGLRSPKLGQQKLVYGALVQLSDGTATKDLYFTDGLIRRGRVVVHFSATSEDKILSEALAGKLLRKLDAKLKTATT